MGLSPRPCCNRAPKNFKRVVFYILFKQIGEREENQRVSYYLLLTQLSLSRTELRKIIIYIERRNVVGVHIIQQAHGA